MVRNSRNTKEALLDATVRLVAAKGLEAATINAIARQAGVTEGAIYRHYRSKDELRWRAYKRTVEEMTHEKQRLLSVGLPIKETIREWIRLTYAYFDRYPDAFTYVLLTPHPQFQSESELEIITRQGRLFTKLMKDARAEDTIRDLSPELAMCHFTGLMLNIPRFINEGVLQEPASHYVGATTLAIWQVLKPLHPATNPWEDKDFGND